MSKKLLIPTITITLWLIAYKWIKTIAWLTNNYEKRYLNLADNITNNNFAIDSLQEDFDEFKKQLKNKKNNRKRRNRKQS